mgnify:FL=1|tara:strand:+ start:732 stop:1031 length:300 start_codon:yes stop_codon:yes gene_type:complete
MSEESYEDFEETGLSMSQQLELEDLIVKTAFNNSFDVLTKRKTFEELLNNKTVDGSSAIMAHTPDEEIAIESLENMLLYFVKTEEYEKCVEIRDLINKK